ncbi:MAG: hypothetical protein R3E97_19155 [Candidatus Eisenbacteria bacterium]
MRAPRTWVWAVLLPLLALSGFSCSDDDPTGVRYTAAIEGSITFAEPPSSVYGRATPTSGSENSGSAEFDVEPDGEFSVSLPPGEYLLDFRVRFGDQSRHLYVGDSEVSYSGRIRPIRVDERARTREVHVSLGSLEILVEALPEWEGDEVRLDSPLEAKVGTVENGVATFLDPCVPAGRYTPVLRHGSISYYFPSAQHWLEADTVEVVAGFATSCSFDLTHPARIQGTVDGGERRRHLGVRSTVNGLGAYYELPLDGTFDIPVFYDGEVEVAVSDDTGQIYTITDEEHRPWTFQLTRGGTTRVDVPNWDVRIEFEGVSFIADVAGGVSFRSVDVPISYSRGWGDLEDGIVGLVPPGRYKVEAVVGGCGRPWLTTWYPDAEDSSSGTVVELNDDPASRVLRFELRRAPRIEGHLRYRGTQIGVRGTVSLFEIGSDDGLCPLSMSGRGDGRFLLQGISPGTYFVRARWSTPDGLAEVWYPGVDSREEATPIVLEEGDSMEGIDLWAD